VLNWSERLSREIQADLPVLADGDSLMPEALVSPDQLAHWAKGTTTDWANESHAVAISAVYAGVPADGPPPKLDQAYVDQAGLVIDRQLRRAGVRLATILNDAFRRGPSIHFRRTTTTILFRSSQEIGASPRHQKVPGAVQGPFSLMATRAVVHAKIIVR